MQISKIVPRLPPRRSRGRGCPRSAARPPAGDAPAARRGRGLSRPERRPRAGSPRPATARASATRSAARRQVMQDYLGIPSPCSAGLFAGGVHASGVSASLRRLPPDRRRMRDRGPARPRPAARRARRSRAAAVRAAPSAAYHGGDRDRRRPLRDWRTTDTPTLIADDFFAAGAVLGQPVALDPGDSSRLIGTTTINGVEVGPRPRRRRHGPPAQRARLARQQPRRARRGRSARGEIVLLGSLVETKWLARGDSVAIAVSGLDEVDSEHRVRFSRLARALRANTNVDSARRQPENSSDERIHRDHPRRAGEPRPRL